MILKPSKPSNLPISYHSVGLTGFDHVTHYIKDFRKTRTEKVSSRCQSLWHKVKHQSPPHPLLPLIIQRYNHFWIKLYQIEDDGCNTYRGCRKGVVCRRKSWHINRKGREMLEGRSVIWNRNMLQTYFRKEILMMKIKINILVILLKSTT